MASSTSGGIDGRRSDARAMRPALPLSLRLLNWAGRHLERAGAFRNLLSADSIMEEAERRTGLSDWGDEGFTTALELLTQPDRDELRITFYGERVLRGELVRCLANRLLIQDEVEHHPETLMETISRPLFVVGLPRVGSTLLQRLLSEDPHCRPLLHWETFQPAPAPDPRTHQSDPRIERAERDLRSMRKLFPEYLAWQAEQDMSEAYAYYKLQLQILQRNFPPAHWVLKASDHLPNLGVLLSTFPDACVVHLHRDLKEVVPSLSNIAIKSLGMTNALDDDVVAEIPHQVMDGFLHDIERAMSARRQADPERIFDVRYRDLVEDSPGVIRRIYGCFGYPFTEEFEARTVRWLDENPREKHGTHHYSLEQCGLTPAGVDRLFSDYCREFGIGFE